MSDHDPFDFSEGIMLIGSACDQVGHDTENAIVAYDFRGSVARICTRPWCGMAFEVVALDDLAPEEYDELMAAINEISDIEHYE